MIGAFADLWFRFVLQVWSLRPVERDRASSLWKRIIHSLMTLIIRNVGSNNAPQITCKLPNHIQEWTNANQKVSTGDSWKANFMVFIDCISIYGFRSKNECLFIGYLWFMTCDIHICCPKTLFAFVPLRTRPLLDISK